MKATIIMDEVAYLAPLPERIWEELRQHVGAENAISAPDLAAAVDAPERTVRRVISEQFRAWAAAAGVVICSRPGHGFYIATQAEEIAANYRTLLGLSVSIGTKLREFQAMAEAAGFGAILKQHA